jgi:anti-sigma factor RsiW
MTCAQVMPMLSAYLDGAVTGKQMRDLSGHLHSCASCSMEYNGLRRTQALVSSVGRAKAPADLSLKLRLAISHEAARRRRPYLEGSRVRMENALSVFMVPATTGLVATVLAFGFLAALLSSPMSVQANAADVPLVLATEPILQQSSFGYTVGPITADSLVIEAYVDVNGRVQDYRILSKPDELADLPHPVKNLLIFTTFRPATWLGTPRPGTAILSFSKISVKG